MAGSGGDEGSGKMMSTVIFVAGFLIAIVFLMYSFGSVLYGPGDSSGSRELTAVGFSADELATYNLFNTSSGNSTYEISPDKVGDHISIPSIAFSDARISTGGWTNMTFVSNGGTNIHLYVIDDARNPWVTPGNRVGHVVVFYCHTGWWDAHSVILQLNDIIHDARIENGVIKAKITIQLDQSYTAFFVFPAGSDPITLLNNDSGYVIALGQSQTQSLSSAGYSGWNYVIGIISFNIPNGGTGYQMFDVMISVVINASLLFIAFWALTRLIGALMP
jgi:hypothetical protein